MRVLFISNLYPPHGLGGMEIRCKETVDMLRARGHGCYVLTSRFRVADAHSTEERVSRRLHLQANINYYRPLDFFFRRPSHERANRDVVHNRCGQIPIRRDTHLRDVESLPPRGCLGQAK